MKRKRMLRIFLLTLIAALLFQAALAADYWICPGCGKRVRESVGDMCPYCGHERHVHDWAPATCVSPQTCRICGETEGVLDPANHVGETEIRNRKEATCRDTGYTGDCCCASCGQVLESGQTIPAAEHQWSAGTVIQAASCIQTGRQQLICAVCGLVTEQEIPIDPTKHTGSVELRNYRPAACDAAGYTGDSYCRDCGTLVMAGYVLPATDQHDWQPADCTSPKTCRICGRTEGGPADHQWDVGQDIRPATCKEPGVAIVTCQVCGRTDYRVIPADPARHTWNDGEVIYPSTCMKEGLTRFTCINCGQEDYRNVPVNRENHGETEIRGRKEATCTETGYTGDVYCTDCGEKIAAGSIIPVTEHDWLAATRNQPKTCRKCGQTTGEPLPSVEIGSLMNLGHYEQDNNRANGGEAIEWQVLNVDEASGMALLISRFGLDVQPYHKDSSDVTWETSSLREWLNDQFLNAAFTKEERAAIVMTEVDNSGSQGYSRWNSDGGNDTLDKVFLLSYTEANYYFDVQYNGRKGSGDNAEARVAPTAYAKMKGAVVSVNVKTLEGQSAGRWWLRSPGNSQSYALYIHTNGAPENSAVNVTSVCVRPAIWISLDAVDALP